MVEISGVLHYRYFHNHILVLRSKTRHNAIVSLTALNVQERLALFSRMYRWSYYATSKWRGVT